MEYYELITGSITSNIRLSFLTKTSSYHTQICDTVKFVKLLKQTGQTRKVKGPTTRKVKGPNDM